MADVSAAAVAAMRRHSREGGNQPNSRQSPNPLGCMALTFTRITDNHADYRVVIFTGAVLLGKRRGPVEGVVRVGDAA